MLLRPATPARLAATCSPFVRAPPMSARKLKALDWWAGEDDEALQLAAAALRNAQGNADAAIDLLLGAAN